MRAGWTSVVAHLGSDGIPVPFSSRELFENWNLEPQLVLGILWALIVYLVCWYRSGTQHESPLERWRPFAFVAGLLAFVMAVAGPFDRYGDVDAAIHMAQHMTLLYVVAPLIVLGAPVTVIVRGLHPRIRRRWVDPLAHLEFVRWVTDPWVAAAVYIGTLYATHFTGLYNAALSNRIVHDVEHLAYVVAALFLWTVLVGRDGRSVRRSGARRILVVFALEPLMTLLAMIFIVAPEPLYGFYSALPAPWGGKQAALASQQVSGAVMWLPSTFVTLGLLIWLVYDWFRIDEAARDQGVPSKRSDTDGVDDIGEGPDVGEGVGVSDGSDEGEHRRLVAPSA